MDYRAQLEGELRRRKLVAELEKRKADTTLGAVGTFGEQFVEGATGGFYDRLPAGIAAGLMSGANEINKDNPAAKKYGDEGKQDLQSLYELSLSKGREKMKARTEANPVASTAGYIAGAIASPVGKMGLLPNAVFHGLGNTEGLDPTTGDYYKEAGIRTALNTLIPLGLKGTGQVASKLLGGTKVGQAASGVADKIAEKLNYISPEKLRIAQFLRQQVGKELDSATDVASQAAKYGGADLPLAVTGNEASRRLAKVALSQPSAAAQGVEAIKNITNLVGRDSVNYGKAAKGVMGEKISSLYDAAKSSSLEPTKKMVQEIVKGSNGVPLVDAATGGNVATQKVVQELPKLLKDNPGAANWTQMAVSRFNKDATPSNKLDPNSFSAILAGKKLAAKSLQNDPSRAAEVSAQFSKVTDKAFSEPNKAFSLLASLREANKELRKTAASSALKDAKQGFKEIEMAPGERAFVKFLGKNARNLGAALGWGRASLEDVVADNPAMQRELARIVLQSPTAQAATYSKLQPTKANEAMARLLRGGSVGSAEQTLPRRKGAR